VVSTSRRPHSAACPPLLARVQCAHRRRPWTSLNLCRVPSTSRCVRVKLLEAGTEPRSEKKKTTKDTKFTNHCQGEKEPNSRWGRIRSFTEDSATNETGSSKRRRFWRFRMVCCVRGSLKCVGSSVRHNRRIRIELAQSDRALF